MNFIHSSRKAWSVIRRLGAANAKCNVKSSITANKVASRIQIGPTYKNEYGQAMDVEGKE